MNNEKLIDNGLPIDWGNTSCDYAEFRSGPPDSFYKKLQALGIGLPNQRILDLGTGTGVLARHFAQQSAIVSGTDISDGQIQQAKHLAKEAKLNIDFHVSPAESNLFQDHTFDVITANQCWLYFNKEKTIREVKRLLRKGGVLATSYYNWLPLIDPIAKASEVLILKYNLHWDAHSFNGYVTPMPRWAEKDFILKAMFSYEEAIPFTRESWRGRIRACRGTGAILSKEELQKFDEEHNQLLQKIAPENFTVTHQLWTHIMQPNLD